MRRTQQPAFASPVLIGAVTVLVAIVAVFLAYNANGGLPFVPTRELRVDVANGAAVVPGNDVIEGGDRVGIVSSMQPIRLPDGQSAAQLTLELNTATGGVPVDSTVSIDSRSLLGLKYVNLSRGGSKLLIADGGTLPITQTSVPVQFDDIDKMFSGPTRTAVQRDLVGFGDALASRGSSLNDTIASLPALFGHLQPVAAYLSDPGTQLTRFLKALDGFFGTVSPLAATDARLFAGQATTFAAISNNAADLEGTIRESPSTLQVSTASLQAQEPLYSDLATFARYMAPATAALRAALPNIDPALQAGIRVLPRTPSMNVKLEAVLGSLKSLALDPGTNVALNALSSTVGALNPMIRYLGPFVTVCNEWNYFWAELADVVSEQTSLGNAQRALLMFANQQTNSIGNQGASAPANGQGVPPGEQPEYLHGPAYGAAVTNSGAADCEVGQRGYELKQNSLDSQGRNLVSDAHTPGAQGTTWDGLARVPAGETFSREPTTGASLPNIPGNN